MFKTVEELKEFISWARTEKVLKMRIADVEFELSAFALLPEEQSAQKTQELAKALGLEPLSPEDQKKQEEDLLFHSAQ